MNWSEYYYEAVMNISFEKDFHFLSSSLHFIALVTRAEGAES